MLVDCNAKVYLSNERNCQGGDRGDGVAATGRCYIIPGLRLYQADGSCKHSTARSAFCTILSNWRYSMILRLGLRDHDLQHNEMQSPS